MLYYPALVTGQRARFRGPTDAEMTAPARQRERGRPLAASAWPDARLDALEPVPDDGQLIGAAASSAGDAHGVQPQAVGSGPGVHGRDGQPRLRSWGPQVLPAQLSWSAPGERHRMPTPSGRPLPSAGMAGVAAVSAGPSISRCHVEDQMASDRRSGFGDRSG